MQSVFRAIKRGNAIVLTETRLNRIGLPETVVTGVQHRKGCNHASWHKLKTQNGLADKQ